MFSLYIVAEPERLDQLCAKLFGSPGGYVEAILDANPGLADEGIELTVGRELRIPQDAVGDEVEVVRLWT